jgi:hypothetical protein
MKQGNSFLNQFLSDRASYLDKQAKSVTMAGSAPPSSARAGGAKNVIVPVSIPALGALPSVSPEMSLAQIIEKKPGKKEIEKYFKARCERLIHE